MWFFNLTKYVEHIYDVGFSGRVVVVVFYTILCYAIPYYTILIYSIYHGTYYSTYKVWYMVLYNIRYGILCDIVFSVSSGVAYGSVRPLWLKPLAVQVFPGCALAVRSSREKQAVQPELGAEWHAAGT